MYNFGKIKHNIYEVAIDGIADKDDNKKALLKKYIKTLKESKILRVQAGVYYNIENRVDENDYSASEYIKENISLLQRYSIADIVKENKKLAILLEGYDIVDNYDGEQLHENIHNLITTKKTSKTMNQLAESSKFVKDYIKGNLTKVIIEENYLPNSMLSKFLSDKFNAKYESLTEAEVKLVKSVLTVNESEQLDFYDAARKETIDAVNESIKNCVDVEVKGKLLDVKERLLESKYNKETFTSDVVKIINLQKNLND